MSSACSNCGSFGHFFRECSDPITSLGILAFRRPTSDRNTLEWLLIRRRDSLGFIEIMRGKYLLQDIAGIQSLIDQTTPHERERLQTLSFNELWSALWNGQASRRYMAEYDQAKRKFEQLVPLLPHFYACSITSWAEPEWGFPKGRRSSSETELACAFRETLEEAGIQRKNLTLVSGDPLVEEFYGSNGVFYRHRYWLAETPASLDVRLDPMNRDQRREIGAVQWFSMEDAIDKIRPYNVEKRKLLQRAHAWILNQK
jgi:8-oxo-dGTP pyrophosphatase MutT (NUDIX family)